MPTINRISEFHEEAVIWRKKIHAEPETAFEEVKTAAFVASKLTEFGIQVHEGIAKTGVVGVLKGRSTLSSKSIALRADMDALPIQEIGNHPYKSQVPGKMHACGHDGHTTMLLTAARYLAETRNFDGTVYFFFQPAEEQGGGANVMIQEGLFDRFPCDKVFGIHNIPGLETGHIATRVGPIMAISDTVQIQIKGKGGHGAMPHETIDPIVIGSLIVNALQTIASRSIDPVKSAVVTITQFHSGETNNAIPGSAFLEGTIRAYEDEIYHKLQTDITRISQSIARANNATAKVTFPSCYPATINTKSECKLAIETAQQVVPDEAIDVDVKPLMGGEDFSYMLQQKPGAFIFLGNGVNSANLHTEDYDFNDDIIPIGASFWARLVEKALPAI
jgi:amidohydrolase